MGGVTGLDGSRRVLRTLLTMRREMVGCLKIESAVNEAAN
jgi:hypothetical protein